MRSPSLRSVAYLLVFGALAIPLACASTEEPGTELTAGRSSDVITEEELGEVFVSDLYQAVERLRPLWLRSRGSRSLTTATQIAVIRDGVYFGDIEQLRTIPTTSVVRLEYLDAATAASRIPGVIGRDRVVEGAIVVTLGRPG